MHLIDGAGHVSNQFVAEDAAIGRPPTEITADIMNALQNEIANAVEAMGLALSKASDTQLRDGLNSTFARRDGTVHYVAEIYNIVADQAALAEVPTGSLPPGARVLVTSYYGLHQAAMATWADGTWTAVPTPLNVFDLYATTYDSHGYYWFSGDWNLFDVAVAQIGEATEEASGIIRLATWADVLAGGLAALALRPRHMLDYLDQMFVGMVEDFSGTTPPAVWLPAAGQLVLRAARPKLWAFAQASGNIVAESAWSANNQGKFSSGDGSTNFRVPDLRGEFRRGWDSGRGVDAGRALGSIQGDAIRNITGSMIRIAHGRDVVALADGAFSMTQSGYAGNATGGGSTDIFSFDASRVVPTANENRPRNVALLTCIYAGAPV